MAKRFKPATYEFLMPQLTITLPHLNYKIRIRHIPAAMRTESRLATCQRDGRHGVTLFLPKWCTPCLAAHELTHMLQFLCRDRGIMFDDELEHMGYIMQHCMGKILGMVWSNR